LQQQVRDLVMLPTQIDKIGFECNVKSEVAANPESTVSSQGKVRELSTKADVTGLELLIFSILHQMKWKSSTY